VGTEYPFDRLVERLDNVVESGGFSDEVYSQIGNGKYVPKYMRWVRMLSRGDFDDQLRKSEAVISHAGMGTIIRCLELRKPLLVVPRRSARGEHVNDHQVATARTFSRRSDVLVVMDVTDLETGVQRLRSFRPQPESQASRALIEHLRACLDAFAGSP
jgi:UDP-N-acetylglucosamine transferase subunit ALG13